MKLPLLIFCLVISFFLKAQSIPKFGSVEKEDFKETVCTLDKTAPAEIIYEIGDTRFEYNNNNNFFKMITERKKRIRIFNQKGLEFANVKLRFYSDEKYERISKIVAYTYNLNGDKIEETKLEKNLIFTQKINDQVSEISFSLPNVKVGSIIEYKYEEEKNSFSNLDNWYFQSEIPTRYSQYVLEAPEIIRFVTRTLVYLKLERDQKEDVKKFATGGGIVTYNTYTYSYALSNIPALKGEPYMASMRDYVQRLEFQLSSIATSSQVYNFTTTWEKLTTELREDNRFGEQIKRKVSIPDLDDQLDKLSKKEEIIKAIYQYFKLNFTWDGIVDFYCMNVKSIAESKKGSTGDLNLLFLSKLKEYKIESYPVLASTKSNGMVNTGYPFLKQFNTLLCYIPLEEGKYYIINAADKYNSINLIPYEVVNTEALQIGKTTANWINLYDETMIEKNIISYNATIKEDGMVEGKCYLNSSGYAKPPRLRTLTKNKSDFENIFLNYSFQNIKIDNLNFANENNDSIGLEQKFNFNTKIKQNGDYSLLEYNLFNNLKSNPFVADTRVSDIEFGCPKTILTNAHITVSDQFNFEELPKNIKMIMPDTGIIFERKIFKEENDLSISITLKIVKSYYAASDYEMIKEFYKTLYAYLEEPIVLKRKK